MKKVLTILKGLWNLLVSFFIKKDDTILENLDEKVDIIKKGLEKLRESKEAIKIKEISDIVDKLNNKE